MKFLQIIQVAMKFGPAVVWLGGQIIEAISAESEGGKAVTSDEAAAIIEGFGNRIAAALIGLGVPANAADLSASMRLAE